MHLSIRTWPSRLLARPWLLAFVPINAATAGFGVVLPLLILIPLHGTWADVAFAAVLFNTSIIIASMLWGWLSDRFPHRRAFLVANYAGFAVLYLVLTGIPSLPVLYLVYTLIGLISPAGTSASNLLILEKFSESERPSAYASFQEMSILGSLLGLLLGFLWTLGGADGLSSLVEILAGLAAGSAVVVFVGVRDAARTATTMQIARHPESLVSRIRHLPALHISVPFFPRRPGFTSQSLARFRKWAREELHHELPLIMGASFLFNLTANLYNISYTPFLYSAGLGVAAIFLINFSNNFAQALIYPATGNLNQRVGSDRLVQWATYLRCLGYLGTALFTLVIAARSSTFEVNLVLFGVLGGAIAVYTTSSSLMLFRGLKGRDAGSLLGVNSALGGVAAVLGASLAGVLALFGSYRLVFLVSAGGLLISVPVWSAASVAYARRRAGGHSPPVSPAPAGGVPAATQMD